jgi:hypothetical protein
VINKSDAAATIDVSFETGGARPLVAAFGFDDAHPQAIGLDAVARQVDDGWQIDLPARSARRFAFA